MDYIVVKVRGKGKRAHASAINACCGGELSLLGSVHVCMLALYTPRTFGFVGKEVEEHECLGTPDYHFHGTAKRRVSRRVQTAHSTSTGLMHGAQGLRLKQSSGNTLGGTLVLDGDMVCIVEVDVRCMNASIRLYG